MPRNRIVILGIAVLCLLALPAKAAAEKRGFEGMFGVGIGAGPGAAENAFVSYPLTLRLRYLPQTPFGLELNLLVPNGAGANLLLDVYRGERLRVHAFDLGIFKPFSQELAVVRTDVKRDFDITLGIGLEYDFALGGTLAVDWRVFLPDPTRIPFYYGAYAMNIYRDALIGSQLWISCGWKF